MKLFVIAGEPSGDRLGAALMAGLRQLAPGIAFEGVGGPLMMAQGLQSLFPMEELSVMGLAEIVPRYRALRRRMIETADAAIASAPDALVTIDSPDFCLRVARRVRHARPDQPTVHYVAPSVWAWRPGRATRMAEVIDHVLALLPFEPPLMQAAGMSCDFVGHPVVAEPQADPAAAAAFRQSWQLDGAQPLVVALPGSRRGELARLGPRFGATLRQVATVHPRMRVVVPTLERIRSEVEALVAGWPGRPVVVSGEDARRAAFAAGDMALAASGTVSLELAAAGLPMVIGYDVHWITRAIMRRLMRIDTVTLVNLVSDTRAVPEFLGRRCDPDLMAPALLRLFAGGSERQAQIAAMDLCMDRLGRGAPEAGMRAARSVLGLLGSAPDARGATSPETPAGP